MIGQKGVPYPAGIENFTEQVGWRLAQRGHSVTVYVRPYVEVGESYRGMTIRRLPSINTKHLDAISHTLVASLDALVRGFDVVHYHAIGPSVLSFVPRLRRTPTVAQLHGLDWQRAKWSRIASLFLQAGEIASVYFPNRTVVVSRALQRYVAQTYHRDAAYVPTGVESFEHVEPDEIRRWGLREGGYLLFLSRLVPEKGCHYLIDAYRRLGTEMPLVIAGSGTHTDSYESSLRAAAGPKIIFTGTVRGRVLQELFANAYAYVLPSDIEGLPQTLLEALGHGRCVLASDIEPNVEALGDCGLTFRASNVDDLHGKLRYLLDHPERVAAEHDKARRRAREHYGWEAVVDRLEAVYESCLPRTPLREGLAQ